MSATETLLIPLACGAVARVAITVEEEPLPTPLERGAVRAPSIRELDEIAAVLTRRGWQFPNKYSR